MDKLKRLLPPIPAGTVEPKSLLQKLIGLIRWQDGTMDTYYMSGTTEKRPERELQTKDQWAYRYPAPGCVYVFCLIVCAEERVQAAPNAP